MKQPQEEEREIRNMANELGGQTDWPYDHDISQTLFVLYAPPHSWQFKQIRILGLVMRIKGAKVDFRAGLDRPLPVSALPVIDIERGKRPIKLLVFRQPKEVVPLQLLGVDPEGELHPDLLDQYEQTKDAEEEAEKEAHKQVQARKRKERKEMKRLIQYIEHHGTLENDTKRAIVAPMKRMLGLPFDYPPGE